MSVTPLNLRELRDNGALERAKFVEMVIASPAEGWCACAHYSNEHLEEPCMIVS